MAIGLMGCSQEPECGEYPLSDDQRRCVVGTVDEMVNDHYPFADYKGVDLDEFSRELWDIVDNDTTDNDFLADLNYTLRMLDDAHTRLERRALEEPAVAPVDIDIDAEKVTVSAVDHERLADLVGKQIVEVDAVPIEDVMDSVEGWTEGGVTGEFTLTSEALVLAGEKGTSVALRFADGSAVDLQRRRAHDEPEVRRYGDDDQYGYLRVDTFGFIDDLDRIDEAMNEVMDTEGLIIDLRDNGGGFPSVSDGLFGRLIDEEVPPFSLVDINGETSRELQVNVRGDGYQGEVVLLTNGRSYSASNYFAHRMVYHDRGILVGGTTGGGAAAPKKGVNLLPGLWFQVSSHVVRTPEGDHFESGIKPAIPVSSDDQGDAPESGMALTGDPVMDRALQYLGEL